MTILSFGYTVRYGSVQTLTLSTGSSSDTINVQHTEVGMTTRVNAGGGDDTINVGDVGYMYWLSPLTLDGQGGSDSLFFDNPGDGTGRTYTLSNGATYSTLTSTVADPINYAGFEALTLWAGRGNDTINVQGTPVPATLLDAGAGDDTVRFSDGQGVSGRVDGGPGINSLSYAAYNTDVVVNLPLGTATNVSGGISNIQNVIGGSGNDILVGDDASNALSGGPGRDLLIAGGSSYQLNPDTLFGGGGEDILIGGYTVYDTDPAALAAILAEWVQPTDYWTRALNLYYGAGVPALNEGTVFYNYAIGGNTLTGGADVDWFFGNLNPDQWQWVDTGDWDPSLEWFLQVW